ncbi:non-ribosomal peptide synthetase [Actinoallomurus rhizosphaericola]|uniref:non-ribosomal peptide synthetase n=1 Tax=Actinoallomurus rhizosphaericola TaxID=2952536 RepID=UPI00209363D5|nr:non-ribosomal peptide synthetase [Actinoallomurus rhizosphaericola]MCO5995881.1 amino acid adenylation domain-containing protein [Actinoallomurus rhizosphaericola]
MSTVDQVVRERLEGTRRPDPGVGRAERGAEAPLSWGQRQFLALHAAAPENPEYLVPMMFRLRGALRVPALAEAWTRLVARHEILRTTYAWDGDGPRQLVHEPGAVDFAVCEEGGAADRDVRTREIFERETAIPIDLERRAPLRVRLIRYAEDDHVLLALFHHIACDAMTHGIVAGELSELYAAAVGNRPDRLPPVSVQYADYAAWERSQTFDLGYWREQLADPVRLELPTDRPRPAERDWTGATVPVTVPGDVARRIRDLATRHGATPYVVLLTAFQALLARYTGTPDVAVGTAVSGRNRPELERLVGYAFNTLVLRARWDGGSFGELLAANRDRVLDALDNADTPFLAVADEVRPSGDQGLFQVMLDLRAGPDPSLTLPGVTAEPLPTGKGVARFDLTLHLRDAEGAISGELEYATALFDEATAVRIAEHYALFLDRATADPDAPVALIDFLPERERRCLLRAPEPAAGLRFRLAGAPDAVAVAAGDAEVTYAELDARANQYAHHLLREGAGPDSIVGVRMRRTPDMVACLLGVWRTGAAYVPIDVSYPEDRVAYMLANSGATVVVDEDADVGALPTTPVAYDADPDSLAYVMYTSGSTGRPKGVAVTHRGLANYLAWAVSRYAGPRGGAPFFSSIAFDLGVPNLFAPLLVGQSVRLIPDDFDPAELGELLAAGAPYGFVKLTPGHLDLLSRQLTPEQARSFADLVIAAGDEFPHRLVRRWAELGGPPLAAEYGPTEITVGNSAQFDVGESTTELVPIGAPIPGTTMYVLDEAMLPAPVGVVGEVYIGGVGLARGYVGRPGLTAEKFLPDPYGEPGSRLYRTGDLARVLPDGSVDFAGRVDHQVKLRGYRIELDEIEAVLTADSGVRDAVVALREDRLVAYVVGDAEHEGLRRRAARALPSYMVPSAFVTLDAIPLTANGKVDRRALPAPGREALTDTGYAAPSGPTQELIARIWSQVLKVDRPGAEDSFFDLGGDSISAVGLAGALRDAGFDLGVKDVFAARTIAALAELADGVGAAEPSDTTVAPFALLDPADRAALPPDLADAYPISLTQRGMLLEMLAGGEENHYHNITAFRILDAVPFSLDAFLAAADLIVARHEVMRTAYDLTSYSVPLQLVRPHAEMPVGFTDLRHLDPDARHAELLAHCAAERAVLFDLENPPLMRMHVHLCDDESWWLSITECHPILEGWSYHSQLMEMLRAYQRIRDGLPPEDAEPVAARYADFIATELKALDSAEDREYWTGVLTEHGRFTVPDAWADPAGGTERYQLTIPLHDIEEALRALATAADAPYKSVLHAAHLYVLSRLTPEKSFHSGVVCDGRPELPGFDRVSGMYLNSVPFPHSRGARSWRELVRETFDSEITMWPHRHFPMPAMPALAGGGRPVDVLFHYLDFHQVDRTLVDVEACIDDSPNEFGLVVGTPNKGNLSIASTPAVLSQDNAARLAGLYRAVLEAMAADPDGDPRSLALPGSPRLHGAEREPGDLGDLLANGDPDAVAVIADGRTHTFGELADRANRVASHLRERGLGTESTVGVLLDRGFDLVASVAGVLKAGAAYVPVDPAHLTDGPVEAFGGTALVLTSAKHAGRVREAEPVLVAELPEAPSVAPATDPDAAAYVIHTSGSTGRPNAVTVTRRALANYLDWAVTTYAGSPGGAPVFSSIAFDITVPNLLAPLLAGQPVCVLPQDLDPADLGPELLRHAPYGFVMLTASHLGLLLDRLGPEATRGLAGVLVSAGEALNPSIAGRLPGLRVEYGPTEATVGVCGERVDGTITAPLGAPIPGTVVQILDAELLPVQTGVVGELYVGGAGLARGYAGAPGRTAERFVPDPYGPPGARLYRTGDLARMTPDGRLEFAGRTDDQVKVRGHRVEPAQVEAALLADPRVERAAVVLHDGALVAYVVTSADAEDVRGALTRVLPGYLVPAAVIVLPDLPLTRNGKLDRNALPAPPRPGAGRGGPPASDAERILAEIWSRLTGAPVVGVEDRLFDLGADSLLILQVLAEAERRGLDLPRGLLRANATLGQIAAEAQEIQ